MMVNPPHLPDRATIQRNLPPDLNDCFSPHIILAYAKDKRTTHLYNVLHCLDQPHRAYLWRDKLYSTVPFYFNPRLTFTDELLWYLWCCITEHSVALVLHTLPLLDHLINTVNHDSLLWTFLEWFHGLQWWRDELYKILQHKDLWKLPPDKQKETSSIFILHRPYYFNKTTGKLWAQGMAYEWATISKTHLTPTQKPLLQNFLREINNLDQASGPDEVLIIPNQSPSYPDLPRPGPSSSSDPGPSNPAPMDLSPPDNNLLGRPADLSQASPDFQASLFQDSQDPYDGYSHFDCWMDHNVGPQWKTDSPRETTNAPWWKGFGRSTSLDSDDSDYRNLNVSLSQNSM